MEHCKASLGLRSNIVMLSGQFFFLLSLSVARKKKKRNRNEQSRDELNRDERGFSQRWQPARLQNITNTLLTTS